MSIADILVALVGAAVGFVCIYCMVRSLIIKWLRSLDFQGPDFVARHLRGRVLAVFLWHAAGLGALVLLDIFYLKNQGILYSIISAAFADYPNSGSPTWPLWGGCLLGLVTGGLVGGKRSLGGFPKCRRIGWGHLIGGFK